MTDTIALYFNNLKSDQISWLPLGKRPSPVAPRGQGSLSEAARQIKGWRHLAIVASPELLLTQVDIPAKNRQRLIQAIPFSLENDLTEEIDDLHFAHESHTGNGTAVAVISRQRLSNWLEQLKQQELVSRGLFPAVLCLPLNHGNWSVYLDNDRCLVRTADNSGFVADTENLGVLLRQALNESPIAPAQLDLFVNKSLSEEAAVSMLEGLETPHHLVEVDADIVQLVCENLDEKHAINLLQGDFKQVDSKSLQWKRWLPAALLFSGFVILSILSTYLDYADYTQQSLVLRKQTDQVFRETFPEVKRIVDPKVQMEQQLSLLQKAGGVGSADFLSLLAHPAATVNQTAGSNIESISFRDGQLDLKMTLKDLQSLDAIKKMIESKNLFVEIRSANANGNQITSHLRIKRSKT